MTELTEVTGARLRQPHSISERPVAEGFTRRSVRAAVIPTGYAGLLDTWQGVSDLLDLVKFAILPDCTR